MKKPYFSPGNLGARYESRDRRNKRGINIPNWLQKMNLSPNYLLSVQSLSSYHFDQRHPKGK
jgi:hypothetical protein